MPNEDARSSFRDHQKTFEWSFKPLLMWLNIIGIPLKINKLASSGVQFGLATIFGLLVFTTFVAFQVAYFFINLSNASWYGSISSSTLRWNIVIHNINDVVSTFGTHFVLMTYCLVNWKDLVQVLHRMERFNLFEKDIYYRVRCVCSCGLALVILVSILN